jgi:hypothetical protein
MRSRGTDLGRPFKSHPLAFSTQGDIPSANNSTPAVITPLLRGSPFQ